MQGVSRSVLGSTHTIRFIYGMILCTVSVKDLQAHMLSLGDTLSFTYEPFRFSISASL